LDKCNKKFLRIEREKLCLKAKKVSEKKNAEEDERLSKVRREQQMAQDREKIQQSQEELTEREDKINGTLR